MTLNQLIALYGTEELEIMASWPTGWQRATLRASGIPVTQFALDVLSAWQQSTPTELWTSNPLGMPVSAIAPMRAMNTPYAAFVTMQDFRDAFKRWSKTSLGHNVLDALISAQSYSDAWREIHALKWPANRTESEYPVKLMDKVSAAYTDKVTARARKPPTTTGQTHASPDVHLTMNKQAALLHRAATYLDGASAGIAHIMKGMNPDG